MGPYGPFQIREVSIFRGLEDVRIAPLANQNHWSCIQPESGDLVHATFLPFRHDRVIGTFRASSAQYRANLVE
jgi:hypothetical protein